MGKGSNFDEKDVTGRTVPDLIFAFITNRLSIITITNKNIFITIFTIDIV